MKVIAYQGAMGKPKAARTALWKFQKVYLEKVEQALAPEFKPMERIDGCSPRLLFELDFMIAFPRK